MTIKTTYDVVKSKLQDDSWVQNSLLPTIKEHYGDLSTEHESKLKFHISEFLNKKNSEIEEVTDGESLNTFLGTLSDHIHGWFSDNNFEQTLQVNLRHEDLAQSKEVPKQTTVTTVSEQETEKTIEKQGLHTVEASGYATICALVLAPPALAALLIYFKPTAGFWIVIALSFFAICGMPFYIEYLNPLKTTYIYVRDKTLFVSHISTICVCWAIFVFSVWKGKVDTNSNRNIVDMLKMLFTYILIGPLILFPCKVFNFRPQFSIKEYMELEGNSAAYAFAGAFSLFFMSSVSAIMTLLFFFINRLKMDA